MNTVNAPQQDDWDNNIYVVSTTRVLMALGLTFLIRSVCQLFQRMRSAGTNAGAAGKSRALHGWWKERLDWSHSEAGAEDAIGIDVEALALGALGDAAAFSSESVGGNNETLEIALPQPTYNQQARSPRRPVSPRQLDWRMIVRRILSWVAFEDGAKEGLEQNLEDWLDINAVIRQDEHLRPDTFMTWD